MIFQKPIQFLLVLTGSLCVLLGLLGMFLPLLPTTPFLLLAAVCYSRGSERFYQWLVSNRWCGSYISNYRTGQGLPLRQKAVTILLLWLTILATAWLAAPWWWLRASLLGVACGVTIFLVSLGPRSKV